MKKHFLALMAVVLFSCPLFAKGSGGKGFMGGLGYLFIDPNSFNNPGQVPLVGGAHLEIAYEKIDGSQYQSLTPSFVWGNGKFGIGVFATRMGTDLGQSQMANDYVGGEIGVAMASERLTVGLKSYRSISVGQMNDGYADVALNWNGMKRVGFSLGVNAGTTLNNAVKEVKHGGASLGWGFNALYSLEAHYEMRDFDDSNDYVLSVFANAGAKNYYASAGANHYALLKVNELEARLGLNFGWFDLSFMGSKVLDANYAYTYGGTLRVNF